MATETASHILYECVSLAEFRFCRLSTDFFMEPGDYYESPLCKILYYVRGTGLLAE
jgi:hypothetical protein